MESAIRKRAKDLEAKVEQNYQQPMEVSEHKVTSHTHGSSKAGENTCDRHIALLTKENSPDKIRR